MKLITADVAVTLTCAKLVGGLGSESVVIGSDDVELADVPAALVAVAVNVYVVFPVNPVTVNGDDAPVANNPPGELVTL